MNILKFFRANFHLIIFFIAALMIGMLYGWWYIPSSKQLSNEPHKTAHETIAKIPEPVTSETLPPINVPSPSQSQLKPVTPKVSKTPPSLPELSSEYNPPPQSEQYSYQPARPNSNFSPVKRNLGHYPFPESSQKRLVKVGEYYGRSESLDIEAANAFKKMQADAQAQGVQLTIISGFRSISSQEALFQKQIQRKGGVQAAARFSAPPGYSEHHTGYALDIGDGANPSKDLKLNFDNTLAYQWLARNAYQYGFELSFPPNNSQGVSYEPWHWRYVLPPRADEIFMAARNGL
ncbi:MAG: D-alanyl-D-alanine carboxypeptidase family protein [Snowella sp.]|nr:D-alanyl-D-alanine carboxypeptidase family protein [Snowella sp.]